ncbi:MAG: ATP-binding cassette domain-containing protein [Ignisphaera sp.]
MEVVVVENLVKKFKDVVAVNDVSFEIRRGEIHALLGPNGAGKTTTIHIIATILRPTSGRIFVAGHDVVKEADRARKYIGIVFQDPSLDFDLTAYDNMYIHGRLYGLKGPELERKIMNLLDFVELKEFAFKHVRYFSGGMRRRLEIARGLLHEPEVLILDEPTIGLDPQSRARIWDYIRRLKKEKDMTILMTTHYMDEAEELAYRIAIMDHGKIIAEGTAEELKSILGSDVIYIQVENAGGADMCRVLEFVKSCRRISQDRIEVVVDNASKALPEIFSIVDRLGIKVKEVSYRRPTLNEVFLHLTGRELRDSLETTPTPPRFRRWR